MSRRTPTPPSRTVDPPRRWALFERSRRDRVFSGVAGGLGERLGVDPTVVRLSFVALSLAAGIGAILYALAYLVSDDAGSSSSDSGSRTSARQAIAIGLIVLGALLLLRGVGLWFGDGLVWPAVLVALGSAVMWTRSDDTDRARWSRLRSHLPHTTQGAISIAAPHLRIGVGLLLVVAGALQFLRANGVVSLRSNAPLATGAALVAVGVIAGPWGWRLGRQLAEERRQRIRSQERAEVAAPTSMTLCSRRWR